MSFFAEELQSSMREGVMSKGANTQQTMTKKVIR